MMYYSDEYLCHYGVLGMKWGQHLFGKTEASRAGRNRATKANKKAARQYIATSAVVGAYMGGVFGTVLGTMIGGPALSIGSAAIGAIGVGITSSAIAVKESNDIYSAMSKMSKINDNTFDDLMKLKSKTNDRTNLSSMSVSQIMTLQNQQTQLANQQMLQQNINDINNTNMISQQALNQTMSLSISAATPYIPTGAMMF
jgi:esterase/lipase